MTERKVRWVVTGCGHAFPCQVPEWMRSIQAERRTLQRLEQSPILCLACERPTRMVAYRWRWPDGAEARPWARLPQDPEMERLARAIAEEQ